jgi:hypothetical protein
MRMVNGELMGGAVVPCSLRCGWARNAKLALAHNARRCGYKRPR